MTKDTSAPAFPVEADFHTFKPKDEAEWKRLLSGMTLRQYAAIQALQGLLAADENMARVNEIAAAEGITVRELFARSAVGYADALLAELGK